jgi:hypothetical protein
LLSIPLAFAPDPAVESAASTVPALFHLDGEPVRAAVCARDLFEGPAASTLIRGLLDLRQWAVPGVYLLLSAELDASVRPLAPIDVYVGSTKDLLVRVIEQEKQRPDWLTAILLTGSGVTRGDAYQLERALGDALTHSTTPGIVNASWSRLPEFSALDTPWHLRDTFVVLAERCLNHFQIQVRLVLP